VRTNFKIEGPLLHCSSVCIPLLRSLPDWFGLEEAILDYERQVESLPTFLANTDGSVVGFLSLKQHNEFLVMAVHPDFHQRGIGRALVDAAEAHARSLGIEYLQVKTLGPSRPDEQYAGTRLFYAVLGYRPLEEFTCIWDADNPCLVLVKRI
jgi:GNAT superfamily N-acetyltransferase